MAFSSKDWSLDKSDAIIYGIVVGWDNASYKQLKTQFNFSNQFIEKIKKYHKQFKEIKKVENIIEINQEYNEEKNKIKQISL